MAAPERRASAWPHILILLAFCALFTWLFSRFFLRPFYLAESDLYENGLPIFLSPVWIWSSFEFSGLPVLADPQNFTFYPPNMLFGELLHSWTAVVMSASLLAACFTYAYVFSLTGSRTASIFSALAYSLSEDMLERLRHLSHVHAIAWLPLILLSIDRVRGDRPRLWIVIGAGAVGSCILAGHPQPALYVMYCAGLYALVGLIAVAGSDQPPLARELRRSAEALAKAERTRSPASGARWRQFASTAAMFALGILLASVKALPLAESSSLVVRSEGLTFTRFVGPSLTGPQMFSFVFPTILHEPTTELPTYVGIATLLLALIGAWQFRSSWRVAFWCVMCLVGVGMALGTSTPLVNVAYYVPLYSWFRNLSRHMFLFAFGSSVLAGFGLAALQERRVTRRQLRLAAGILACAMMLGAVLIGAIPSWFPLEGPHGEPGPGPLSVLSIGIWIQCAVLIAVVGTVIWMAERPSKIAPALLMAILVADLLSALPYDIKSDGIEFTAISEAEIQPSVHALAIGRALEPTQGRALAIGGTQVDDVLPATFARVWRIPIAGGYGAMLMDRLSRMATMGTNGEVRPTVLADEDATLDLLSVRYVIANENQLEDPVRQRWLKGSARWKEAMHFRTSRQTDRGADVDVEGETDVTVFENRRALPRAWFVGDLTTLNDRDGIDAVRASRLPDGRVFDPRDVAIVDPANHPTMSHFPHGASDARVIRVGDGEVALAASTTGAGFLVLSENAYPGWRARIDGVEVPIYRVDVTLQGIVVPPGTHRVEFTMESRTLRAGLAVSGAAVAMCLALLVLSARVERDNHRGRFQ
jgi:hypothetical protein